jgi:hypothetical protein
VQKSADLALTFFNSFENLVPEEDGEVMENYFRVKGAEVMQNCLEQA